MEQINFIEIEKLAKTKMYSELNNNDLKLINKHFENKEDYDAFRLMICQKLDDLDFPNEIDDAVYNALVEKDKKEPISIFYILKRIAAIVLLLLVFGAGWFSNIEKPKMIVDLEPKTDTLYITKEISILDTIVVEKIIYKEKIVKIFIEKDIKNEFVDNTMINTFQKDSIVFPEREVNEIVENISLDNLEDLSSFFTVF